MARPRNPRTRKKRKAEAANRKRQVAVNLTTPLILSDIPTTDIRTNSIKLGRLKECMATMRPTKGAEYVAREDRDNPKVFPNKRKYKRFSLK